MRIALIFLLSFSTIYCATKYVDSSASGANNGTSWTDAWTAMTSITASGDDIVYISGNSTGNTRTYNLSAYYVPPSGTAGHPITYQIGQDSSHNGTAIFNYTGGSPDTNAFITGASNIIFSGDAGDGNQHFQLTNYTGVCYFNTATNVRIAYLYGDNLGMSAGAGTCLQYQSCNGIEIDHCYFRATSAGTDSMLNASFTGSVYTDNKIHDNSFFVPYISTATGFGADCMAGAGSGWSFYNNSITGQATTYTGGQHADGIQCLGNQSDIMIYGNTFTNMSNYGVFFEGDTGNFTTVYVYDNIFQISDSNLLASSNPAAMVFGTSGGFSGTPPMVFSGIVLANNICVNFGSHSPIALNNITGTSTTFTGCYITNNTLLDTGTITTTGNTTSTVSNNVAISTGSGSANFVSYSQYGGTSNNYHLLSGASTLIHQGTNMQSVFTYSDKDGVAFANPPSVGPYEYSGSGSSGGSSLSGKITIAGKVTIK